MEDRGRVNREMDGKRWDCIGMEDRRRVNREMERKEIGWYWYGRKEEGKQGDGAERDGMVLVWKTGGG